MQIKFVKIAIWFLISMLLFSGIGSLLTMASTFANIIGYLLGVAYIVVTVYTKCFTTITFKRNEKSN